jgi:hypothetical protein
LNPSVTWIAVIPEMAGATASWKVDVKPVTARAQAEEINANLLQMARFLRDQSAKQSRLVVSFAHASRAPQALTGVVTTTANPAALVIGN